MRKMGKLGLRENCGMTLREDLARGFDVMEELLNHVMREWYYESS